MSVPLKTDNSLIKTDELNIQDIRRLISQSLILTGHLGIKEEEPLLLEAMRPCISITNHNRICIPVTETIFIIYILSSPNI